MCCIEKIYITSQNISHALKLKRAVYLAELSKYFFKMYNYRMEVIPSLLQPLTNGTRRKRITKDQVIIYEGDYVEDMLVLTEGIVKIHDIDEHGNEKILHLVKPPGVIPFAFFSGGDDPTRWFYTALTDCEVCIVPRMKILTELADSNLAIYLMNWFSKEVHHVFARLSSLGKTNVHDKLNAALKFLADCHSSENRNGWHRVSFPVTHQLIADMTGITRESVAYAIKDLQVQRAVRYAGPNVMEIKASRLTS